MTDAAIPKPERIKPAPSIDLAAPKRFTTSDHSRFDASAVVLAIASICGAAAMAIFAAPFITEFLLPDTLPTGTKISLAASLATAVVIWPIAAVLLRRRTQQAKEPLISNCSRGWQKAFHPVEAVA